MKPRIFETPADLFQGAAEEFANRAPQALKDHGRFCVALSGGSTPKRLFSLLASGKFSALPWKQIFLFWGDERYVPSDAPESNFRMTKEALLSKVPIPTENVFRIKTEISPSDKAAADYEQTLKTFFNLQSGELPRFDLTLNGVGTEGHTASLFPHSSALDETSRLVVAPWIEKFKMFRISLTLPVFNHAASVMFLVAGKEKAPILQEVFERPSEQLPAQRIQPSHGDLLWFVDRAAAASLKSVA
jgi:6-phosphogluconolactonase